MTESQHSLTVRDMAEIAIGSAALAFPVATTEEVWNLSAELSTRYRPDVARSGLAVRVRVYRHKGAHPGLRDFLHRVVAVYAVTILVCAAILVMLGRFPLLTELSVTIKRTVLVAFPASFSATVVDSLGH